MKLILMTPKVLFMKESTEGFEEGKWEDPALKVCGEEGDGQGEAWPESLESGSRESLETGQKDLGKGRRTFSQA